MRDVSCFPLAKAQKTRALQACRSSWGSHSLFSWSSLARRLDSGTGSSTPDPCVQVLREQSPPATPDRSSDVRLFCFKMETGLQRQLMVSS